jgi:hypothetical protein
MLLKDYLCPWLLRYRSRRTIEKGQASLFLLSVSSLYLVSDLPSFRLVRHVKRVSSVAPLLPRLGESVLVVSHINETETEKKKQKQRQKSF